MLALVPETAAEPAMRYEGSRRVTAAVAVGEDMFIAASDDDNLLRIYSMTDSSGPLTSFDLSEYLEVAPGLPVAIAGATRVGDRVYWITSHSRDEEGRIRPERYRFFATTVVMKNGHVTIEPVGKPNKTLMHKLVERHTVRTLRLDKATRFGSELAEEERRKLAPFGAGLRIGALCASGNAEVLIAFHNPRPLRVTTGTPHALVVPLDNAAEVIEKGEDPIFGEGILWDFHGLGIAGFEYSPFHRAYFIVAGPHDGDGSFVLYRWSGMKAYQPEPVSETVVDGGFFPRTVIASGNGGRILLLGGDAGSQATGASEKASFPGLWFRP